MKKILVISGSPKKNGNTAALVGWLREGAEAAGGDVTVVNAASLKFKHPGCLSCRQCQKNREYGCVIDDDAKTVLQQMLQADVIVMATPLYFFSVSAQLKIIFDRMFSLYKWDNAADTMETPLKGKTFALTASAYEDIGLSDLERPFVLTAEYTGMRYASLLIPDAGESGEIVKLPDVRGKAVAFGRQQAR
jgi:multimeric flavodoxin WrbA